MYVSHRFVARIRDSKFRLDYQNTVQAMKLEIMKKSNLTTNTGHRFISKSDSAFKIHIHLPDDTILHRSVGYLKIGEEKGLRKALKLRNKLGVEHWTRKFWNMILDDPYLFTRLPHSLEPKVVYKPNPTKSNPNNRDECYIAKWRQFNGSGESHYKTVVRSVNKYGKLAAYTQTKKALTDAHSDLIPLISYMERQSITRVL